MGTNYYLRINPCPHCKRADETLHYGERLAVKSLLAELEKLRAVIQHGLYLLEIDGDYELWADAANAALA